MQAVETMLALVLGGLAAGLLAGGVRLVGLLTAAQGPLWSTVRTAEFTTAGVVGVAVTVWRLLRVRRRGL